MVKTKYFNFFETVDKLSDLYCKNEILTPESAAKAIEIVEDYCNDIKTENMKNAIEILTTSVAITAAAKIKTKNNYTRDLAELAEVIMVEFTEIF